MHIAFLLFNAENHVKINNCKFSIDKYLFL